MTGSSAPTAAGPSSLRAAALASVLASTLAAACGAPAERATPDYAAVTQAGDSIALADLRGNVILLNVWATWCAPCRREIPVLQELHERHAGEGLRVVGVSVDDATAGDDVGRFADHFGVSYAIWLDPAERVSSTFLLHGIPSTILIDRQGKERWRKVGPVERADPNLARALDAALAAR